MTQKKRGRPPKPKPPSLQPPNPPYSIVKISEREFWTYRNGLKLNRFETYQDALSTC